MELDELSRIVIGCAIEVHRNLGPRFTRINISSVLGMRAIACGYSISDGVAAAGSLQRDPAHCGYRIDLPVSGDLIAEIKSVETILPIHQAQILTYMRLAKVPLGLLINFNVPLIRDGIRQVVT